MINKIKQCRRVALKYGYPSPTSFNRAFQSVHGIPPTAARNEGCVLNAYPTDRKHGENRGIMNYMLKAECWDFSLPRTG